MLRFKNTEAFWLSVAQAPLAFGAPRSVETIDGPYTMAGIKKWFGKADIAAIIFCVAFTGQRQHAKRIVTAVKSHLKTLATTHDEFAVTVRDGRWELSDGNTRGLLYKALLLKKLGLLDGDIPVDYSYDDLPKQVRITFVECTTVEQSLTVYNQYNSKEAVKTTRDSVHTALKLSAAEFGIELKSEFFRSEGAIVTASEYAFFSGRVRPEIAVKTLQPIFPVLDDFGLTKRPGEATSLPGGAVAALAVLSAIDGTKARAFAAEVIASNVDLTATVDVELPMLFARRVKELKASNQFSSAAGLRPAVAELVGIVMAYAALPDGSRDTVSTSFSAPVTVAQLHTISKVKHPRLAALFARRDHLLGKSRPVAAEEPQDIESAPSPLAA